MVAVVAGAGYGGRSKSKAEYAESPLAMHFVHNNRTVKSYLRKADDAFQVHSISDCFWNLVCNFDAWACGESICGTDKYLDGDDTVATASTAGTFKCWDDYVTADYMYAGTDYAGTSKSWDDDTFATAHTNYTDYTAGTFRTEATGGTYDTRGTYATYGAHSRCTCDSWKSVATIDKISSQEYCPHYEKIKEDNSIVNTEVERRDDDDDATVTAANKEKETKAVGLENTIVCTTPWKDYSETNKAPTPKRSKKNKSSVVMGIRKYMCSQAKNLAPW